MSDHAIDPVIRVESLISSETRLPWVRFEWGPMVGQLTPGEARTHALRVLEVAGGAEMDAVVFEFLTHRVGVEAAVAAKVIQDFRKIREEKGLNDHD